MRSVLVLLLALAATSCGGKGAPMCLRGDVGDAAPTACRAARAVVVCRSPEGFACGCVTDSQSCPDCPSFSGMVCRNQCNADEYAVECGVGAGGDAGPIVVFDDPPPGCQLVARGGGTASAYCCSCL